MKVINTRFNPTTNGPLHLGHIYMVLVNAEEAWKSKGKFILRFDDNQRYWRDHIGDARTDQICSDILQDLQWLGIPPDRVIKQSEIEIPVACGLEKNLANVSTILRGRYFHDEVPETKAPFVYYPYTPYYTLEKVWMDFDEGVNLLIRGQDLITEFALYSYFVDLLGLPRMKHVYLPRLRTQAGEFCSLSKTAGNYKIQDLRSVGITPDQVFECLAESCLINPLLGFSCDNIKEDPVLDVRPLGDKLLKAIPPQE